jgi:glutaminyl-tRNA synthetase
VLNPHSKRVVAGYLEPSLGKVDRDAKVQIERHGYFVADRLDHTSAKPVFNRIAGLKDGWGK